MAPSRVGRRRRWALHCTVVGSLAALGAQSGGLSDLEGPQVPGFVAWVRGSTRPATLRHASKGGTGGIEDILGGLQKQAQDIADAPNRLSKEAQAAVDRTLDSIQRDDGRVLDGTTPAGTVGAVAVSLAVLPYVPLSLYSTYLVLTTGAGLEPGPYGIYGLAEGFATLALWAVALWSLTSFVTRARGLPEGPFNLLGVTQALSIFCALALAVATALSGGSNVNPLGGATGLPAIKKLDLPTVSLPKVDLPKVDLPKVDLPKVDMPKMDLSKIDLPNVKLPDVALPKGLEGQLGGALEKFQAPSALLDSLSKDLNSQVAAVKEKASKAAEEVSAKASTVTSSVQEAAQKVADTAAKVKDAKEPADSPSDETGLEELF